MYLKSIEMQGFKSFADRTKLEFKPGITSVIGPNGSGKSNISDAIRWVLGEQSMKSLRSSKSEDIIFAGTQNRRSIGFAEVSITIDNSDGKLPIAYDEVTVSRKIFRSGESGYYINKAQCRLKDVLELFMDTGIGKDGYSIIGQGRIDEILSNKSEDRRHIFEEAAGIVKYRNRKEESERKLEQTKLNLLRITDIISEIETQLEPLKAQSDKAKEYMALKEELKNIEVGLFIYNINSFKEKLEQFEKDYEIIAEQNNSEQDKLEDLQERKVNIKDRIDDLIELIENTQNLGFESRNKIEQINSEINISKERISNNDANDDRLRKEIDDLKLKNEELEKDKEVRKVRKEDLEKNKKKYEAELKEKEEELEKLTKNLSAVELEIEAKKRKSEQNVDKRYEKQNEISNLDVNFENLSNREKQIKEERNSSVLELDNTRMDSEETVKAFSSIEGKRNKALADLEEVKSKKDEATEKIKEYDSRIERLQYEYRMKDSRCKFLQETEREKEGYSKSVKSLLLACENNSNLNKGIEGVLANLINVDNKYQTAIEMCLGQSLQNIVTEKEEDAKKLIEYLRENNLGRASFLPISSVHGNKLGKINTFGISGVIGIASDLVECDRRYRDIIDNLLGRTVITEDMQGAIELAKKNKYSFRIVTLEGDIINPSGAMTGGSVSKKTVNILGRGKEIEEIQNNLKKIENDIALIEKEKADYENSISDILEEVSKIEKNMQEIEIEYAKEKQKYDMMEESINKIKARIEKLDKETEEIAIKKNEIVERKAKASEEIVELTREIEALNEEINKFAEDNKEKQEYIDNLNTDITDLKISVSSFDESGMSIEEMMERINQDIDNNKNSIDKKKEEINLKKEETENLKARIVELEKNIEEIKNDVDNSSTKIEALKKERDEDNKKLAEIEEDLTKEYEVINDIKEQMVKLESRKTKNQQDMEELINKLWNEYELTPNNSENYPKPNNIQAAQKETNEIRNRIRDLGIVNVNAIEEYKKTQERYDFMNEQRFDLEESISKLNKIIEDMTNTMKKQFAAKFKVINQNFNQVFSELFGGGKAELILVDEDNILESGIDIQAQPPGKKLQNMMLLSGGEKALTAIAILFAILKINPAPFCILDEIEAALDDVNVNRYAEFLRRFSKKTQFLVITHRKGTMEIADTVYGVTMEEKGISKLLSMKLNDAKQNN